MVLAWYTYVLVGLPTVPLLALGLKATLKPHSVMPGTGLVADNVTGMNSFRALLGGVLLTAAALNIVGLLDENMAYVMSDAILMLVLGLVRCLSFGLDGFDKKSLRATIVEFVFCVMLVVAYFLETKVHQES